MQCLILIKIVQLFLLMNKPLFLFVVTFLGCLFNLMICFRFNSGRLGNWIVHRSSFPYGVISLRSTASSQSADYSTTTTTTTTTSAASSLKLLRTEVKYEEVIKKSKFLVFAARAKTFDDAMAYLKKVEDLKATHNCWAWKSTTTFRISDDGEPSGTAGRPILTAIEAMQLTDVVVIVTRYFGGVKLGTGGLIRAYHGVAKNALQLAELYDYIPVVTLKIRVHSAFSGQVYYALDQYKQSPIKETMPTMIEDDRLDMEDDQIDTMDHSMIAIECDIARSDIDKVTSSLRDLCKGNIDLTTHS